MYADDWLSLLQPSKNKTETSRDESENTQLRHICDEGVLNHCCRPTSLQQDDTAERLEWH